MNKNFAYLIGVFLGDGTICSDERTFCLQAIDKDFVVIGKSYEINNGLTCKFLAYDITGVWS